MPDVKYALLAVSHPYENPTAEQMAGFLNEKLPELGSSGDGKVGFVVKRVPLSPELMRDLAIEAFGNDAGDSDKYTYRTIHFGISGGEAKILVAYKKDSPASEGCFIATACYGDYSAPQVLILRDFRDKVMRLNPIGNQLIKTYYYLSPPFANFISRHELLKNVTRKTIIDPIVVVVKTLKSSKAS